MTQTPSDHCDALAMTAPSVEQVAKVIQMRRAQHSPDAIAAATGLSPQQVANILRALAPRTKPRATGQRGRR